NRACLEPVVLRERGADEGQPCESARLRARWSRCSADLGKEPRERVGDHDPGSERNDVGQRRVTIFGRELDYVLSDSRHPGSSQRRVPAGAEYELDDAGDPDCNMIDAAHWCSPGAARLSLKSEHG